MRDVPIVEVVTVLLRVVCVCECWWGFRVCVRVGEGVCGRV